MVIDAVWTVQVSVFFGARKLLLDFGGFDRPDEYFWLLLPAFDVAINRSSDNTGWNVS